MATIERPKDIVIRGRLSFPKFTMPEALAFNRTSEHAKKDEDVRPHFFILLDEAQQNKLTKYIVDEFLPWCQAQEKAGEKRSALNAGQVKKLTKVIEAGEWDVDGVLGLIYPVHEKTAELAPEAESQLKVNGFKGQDLVRKAIVRDVSELRNQVDDIVLGERGEILDINDTIHELYPGSVVTAQLNLYAFVAAGQPGISASTSTIIFVRDDERFGGGGGVDEDDVFMALDED